MLNRIPPIIDYNNPAPDGMLERILSFYVDGRRSPPDDCSRQLPYFKTLKIFGAFPETGAGMMKQYLAEWYRASRRERYHDSHKRGEVFTGYWAWEAAAITYLLDIDDSSYRGMAFYPADLVDFARGINATRSANGGLSTEELRAKSGHACPKEGAWETLDIPLQRRQFKAGEIIKVDDASYGGAIWRYLGA